MPRKKKEETIRKLLNKIIKNSKELKEKGFSKKEILYLVASSIGGLALITGLGLGGVALSRKMREATKDLYEQRNPFQTEIKRRQARKEETKKKFRKDLASFLKENKEDRQKRRREAAEDWEPYRSTIDSDELTAVNEIVLFGKKVSKKPSAALRKMCRKYKVRLTLKRGKKRVYKSEKVLKKQCKTAMRRKK